MAPLPRLPKPRLQSPILEITADRVLKASEQDTTVLFNAATSIIATLPPAQKGIAFNFFVKQVPASGVGPLIKVAGAVAKVFSKVSPTGATITEAVGKGIVNTQATSVKGDGLRVESDGTDWFVTRIAGTWAREA